MHIATMILLMTIAMITLIGVVTFPAKIGERPNYISVSDGLRTIVIMCAIIVWLGWFVFDHGNNVPVIRLTVLIMISRTLGMYAYSGWIDKPRKIITWPHVLFMTFWALGEVTLITLLLITAW